MSEQVVEALTKSIHAIDGSRRVGWAKAFAAEESADEAHRIAALTAEDRSAYRRGASFLWGVVIGLTQGFGAPEIKDELFTETGELELLLDPKVSAAGRRRGERIAAERLDADERAAAKSAAKTEKKRSSRSLEVSFQKGGRKRIADLARSYGFTDVNEMDAVLAKWQEASGRQAHRGDVLVGRYLVGRHTERRLRSGENEGREVTG